MNRIFFILFVTLGFVFQGMAQDADPVLFSVDGIPVHKSEFVYIYSKTNANKADFSEASLKEYLDLYIKFKLKVRRAKEMQLDTIPSLMEELGKYRRQLADSYLIDREVTDKLIEEAYERSKRDVDISHIMVMVPANAAPADTLAAYKKIMEARKKLLAGADFAEVAMEYSEDSSKEQNKGHVGFVTVLFPNGLYALETAAYEQAPGEVSMPIRSRMGYHLIKTNAFRDARGEIEAAHILIRNKPDESETKAAKHKIDSLYNLLEQGEDFETVAKRFSEDRSSAPKGGYLGFFGINRYGQAFENAAFSLKKDGQYSRPVKTNLGWHIIKRISTKKDQPFNIVKIALQNKIKNDARFQLAQKAMIARIKQDNNFTEYPEVLNAYIATLDSTLLTFRWKPLGTMSDKVLFKLGKDGKTTVGEFEDYLAKQNRQRIRMAGNKEVADAVKLLYQDFIEQAVLKYEERHLEEKYPDFKSLMREYEEGILLFEATKIEVWDKASQDSVGLAEFFKTVKGKYKWEERAVVSIYTLKEGTKAKAEEIRIFAANNPPDKTLAKYHDEGGVLLTRQERVYEKSRAEDLRRVRWEASATTPVEQDPRTKFFTFMKIEEILPPGDKTLSEARGYVVADYQDFLEKEWIRELRKKYKVEVNQKVFNQLVKE